MTNREMLIKALNDEFDDYAFSESVIAYHIECPYYGKDMRAKCNSALPNRHTTCLNCKLEWLEAEVDE